MARGDHDLRPTGAFSRINIAASRRRRSHTQRTPAGDTVRPRFLSSLAMRTWPKALLDGERNAQEV